MQKVKTIKTVSNISLALVFAYFFWLMLKLTLEYIPVQTDVSFLMIKQTEVNEHPEYLHFFYGHVYSSIFVLLFGFLAIARSRFFPKKFHAWTGKLYVILLLLFSAPTGLYMGIYANGGWTSKLSFILLSLLWWWTTYKAYIHIKKGNISQHKLWMWRSFALTLSAITLRFWKVIIVYLFQPNPMDVYEIVAWLGWLPNLLLIEYLNHKKIL